MMYLGVLLEERRTDSPDGDLSGPEEEKVIALLHAREKSRPLEVLREGFRQPLVVRFCELNPSPIFFTHVL